MIYLRLISFFLTVLLTLKTTAGPAFTEKNAMSGYVYTNSDSDGELGGIFSALIALVLAGYIGLGVGEAVKSFLHNKRPYGTGNDLITVVVVFACWSLLPVLILIYWKQLILLLLLLFLAVIVWALKQTSGQGKSQDTQQTDRPNEFQSRSPLANNSNISSPDRNFEKIKVAQKIFNSQDIVEKSDRAIHGRVDFSVEPSSDSFQNEVSIKSKQPTTTNHLNDDHEQITTNGPPISNSLRQPEIKLQEDFCDQQWWYDKTNGQLLDTTTNKRYTKSQIKVFANGFLIDEEIWVRSSDVFVTN